MTVYTKKQQTRNKTMTVAEFKAYQGSEHDLQAQCENYLIARDIPFIRVPDAIYKAVFGSNTVKPYLKSLISKFIKRLPKEDRNRLISEYS